MKMKKNKEIRRKTQLFVSLFVFFFTTQLTQVFACEVYSARQFNYHVDLEQERFLAYSRQSILEELPALNIHSCMDTVQSGRYIMIALAQENPIMTNESVGFSLRESEEELECQINDAPFLNDQQSADQRFQSLVERRKFLNTCFKLHLEETTAERLDVIGTDGNCDIERISETEAYLSGRFCFVNPDMLTSLKITPMVREKCLQKDFLAQEFEQLILTDMNLVLNTYQTGDTTGSSVDLTAIDVSRIRLSHNPNVLQELMLISDDFGDSRPLWPARNQSLDVHLGGLEISSRSQDHDQINLPLLVDGRCERVCLGNLCSSPCDYSTPVAAEFVLYDLNHARPQYLSSWYDGGVISAQYFGLVFGIGHEISKGAFEDGGRYKIEIHLKDPSIDYNMFLGRLKQLIDFRPNSLGAFRSDTHINRVPRVRTIGGGPTVTELPRIRGIDFGEGGPFRNFAHVLRNFRSHFSNGFWPPFYRQVCDREGQNCVRGSRHHTKITVEFTVNKDHRGRIFTRGVEVVRQSNVYRQYAYHLERLPALSCTRPGMAPVEPPDGFDWTDF